MSALDRDHLIVGNALRKDGWTITNDPLTVEFDGRRLFIDYGAERIISAEKGHARLR